MDAQLVNQVTLLQSRFAGALKDRQLGLLDNPSFYVEQAKITQATLAILAEVGNGKKENTDKQ